MSNGKNAFFSIRERERENTALTHGIVMPFLTTVIHVGVHLCRSSVVNIILLIFKRKLYPVIHMSLLS